MKTLRGLPWENLSIVIVFFLVSISCWGQITQPARYEREHKNSDHDYIVISMNEEGIALVRHTDKFEDRKRKWEVVLLDSALQERQLLVINLEERLNLIGHDYHDKMLYVLFREGETDAGKLSLLKINPNTFTYDQYTIKPELNIYLTHFSILEDEAILAGYVSHEPAVLLYNLTANQTKVIPGFFLTDMELLDIRVNKNNTFNTLLSGKSKNKKLILRTFDASGTMLMDDVIEVDHDKTILTGITSTLQRDELMIVGSWADGSNRMASGVFTVLADPFSNQKINYYDFPQMNHFVDYLGHKKATKVRARADRKRKQGKVPDFKTSLLLARLEETTEGFALLCEGYYAPYSGTANPRWNNYSNPYNSPYNYPGSYPYGYPFASRYNYPNSYYGPYSGNSMRSSYETKMEQSSVAFFDAKGKLISDVGFSLQGLQLASKEQLSDFIMRQSQVTIAYKKEKELRIQVSDEEGNDVKEESIKTELKDSQETIRTEADDVGNVRFWFGRNLYVWGYQTLKKSGEASRDIFYINKLNVQ